MLCDILKLCLGDSGTAPEKASPMNDDTARRGLRAIIEASALNRDGFFNPNGMACCTMYTFLPGERREVMRLFYDWNEWIVTQDENAVPWQDAPLLPVTRRGIPTTPFVLPTRTPRPPDPS